MPLVSVLSKSPAVLNEVTEAHPVPARPVISPQKRLLTDIDVDGPSPSLNKRTRYNQQSEEGDSAHTPAHLSDSSTSSTNDNQGDSSSPENEQGGLQSRLLAFLPRLAAANKELDHLRQRGEIDQAQLDHVSDDEEHYIEMDLGLGVLEEKRSVASDDETPSSSDDHDDDGDNEADVQQDGSTERRRLARETDRLGKLMGRSSDCKQKPGIQEIDPI